MLDGPEVHGLQDDLVVVGVVLLGGLEHEQVTQPASGPGLPGLGHGGQEDLHPVLLRVLLVTGR